MSVNCELLIEDMKKAPELGRGTLLVQGKYYCALGWLAHCAGVSDEELIHQPGEGDFYYERIFPAIAERYGFESKYVIERIWEENDKCSSRTTRRTHMIECFKKQYCNG